MRLYYRISDRGYTKPKLLGATKEVCLMNFCRVFADLIFQKDKQPPPVRIIADRCEPKTLQMLSGSGLPVTVTDKGNAGSLRVALNLALEECSEDETVYFCEDDYLHLPKAPVALAEGIRRADYVTLYDHPDKYTHFYDGGEISKVIKTASSHWRYTASTCMTFATKPKILRADMPIWEEFTSEDHPHDHFIFKKLFEQSRRRLAVCIPGLACHTDMTFSGRVSHMLIEPWAIEMMMEQRERDIAFNLSKMTESKRADFLEMKSALLESRTGWEKLIALDALFKQTSIDT